MTDNGGAALGTRVSQLVVIGASAGGIDGLSRLLTGLPSTFATPIVIAQHSDPVGPRRLAEILSHHSPLPIRTIEGREALKAGVVYVAPADCHVCVGDGEVSVSREDGTEPKPSVDVLLASAAEALGEGLVAVILSDMGSDGAAGARVVKENGGTVIIEKPARASFPSMPQSLPPTTVDIMADVERIGPLLGELIAAMTVAERPEAEPALEGILGDVRERAGIDFNHYKRPTVMRRLQRRAVATGVRTLEEYRAYLRDHPEEVQRLVASLFIKVTSFFRDPELFASLRERILPELVDHARRQGNEIRLWSAGCATGEEAYSLAITLCEVLGEDLGRYHVRLFATDADAQAIAFARRAVYPATALANVAPALVKRYFSEEQGNYLPDTAVRNLIIFGEHDLSRRPPFPHTDLILCRNVLIYFAPELQRRALQLFAFSLREGGVLALGKTETAAAIPDFFRPEDPGLKLYRRHGASAVLPPGRIPEVFAAASPRDLSRRRQPGGRDLSGHRRSNTPVKTIGDRLNDIFLHAPVGIVAVDRSYDVLHINNAARHYLGIRGTVIGEDLVHAAIVLPPRILKQAVDQAFRNAAPVHLESVALQEGVHRPRFLDIDCQSLPGEDGRPPELAVVVLTDATAHAQAVCEMEEQLTAERRTRQMSERDLQQLAVSQRELDAAREEAAAVRAELQAVQEALVAERQARQRLAADAGRLANANRELEIANEVLATQNAQLRVANEEFLTNNEQVQAASEEVETLNEELQATNEELETLNEELQATVEELNAANDDLQARSLELQDLASSREAQRRESERAKERLEVVLGSMASALAVVDGEERTVLANAAYHQTFGAEVGALRLEDLEGRVLPGKDLPWRRAARGESFRMEFVALDRAGARRWFEAVGNPLPTGAVGAGEAAGLGVVVISDVTDRVLRRLQDEFLSTVIHDLRTPLTAVNLYADLLAEHLDPMVVAGSAAIALNGLKFEVRRLGFQVSELIDAQRLQTGRIALNREVIDLAPVLRRAVDVAQKAAARPAIHLDLPDVDLRVSADPNRLEQVVSNLLENALIHAGGTERVDVRLRAVGRQAQLEVQDYGPGIAAVDLPHIFDRFYRSADARRRSDGAMGLGLGLYIARQLIAAHGGSIRVRSTVGEGTIFTVNLPLVP